MSKDPGWGGSDAATGSRRALPVGALAFQWIFGVLVVAGLLYWLHLDQAKQAEYRRILHEGVATTGLVAEARTDWRNGDEGGERYFLVVRYYTDGLSGPPRPLHPPGGILAEWGYPPMPEMKLMGAKRMQAEQRAAPGPGAYPPPLPLDQEVSMDGGRIVMHPVWAGEREVSQSFYEQAPVGQTVAVRYLAAQPSTFVLVDAPVSSAAWMIYTFLVVSGLSMALQFWRTYVR